MDYRKISASERLPELAPNTSPTAFPGCSEKVHIIVETFSGFIVPSVGVYDYDANKWRTAVSGDRVVLYWLEEIANKAV